MHDVRSILVRRISSIDNNLFDMYTVYILLLLIWMQSSAMKYYTNNTVLAWHWKLIFVESRHTQPHIIDNAFVNTFFRRNLLFNVYTNKWNATCCLQNRIGIDSIIVNVKCCMSPITTVNINSTPAHTKYIQFWKMYQWSIWLLAVSFYSSLPMYFIWPIKLRVKYQIIKGWLWLFA